MLRSLRFILLSGAFLAAAVHGQTPESTYADLMAAMDKAQAQATKPGDASLSCQALENELVATANQSAVQSYIQKSGAAAQKRADALKATSGKNALALFGAVGSFVPGADFAAQANAAAQARAGQAQAAANMQQSMQQAQAMIVILPQLMRGQRIIELALMRNCAWLQGAGMVER